METEQYNDELEDQWEEFFDENISDHLFLLRSYQTCEHCHHWAPVYTLVSGENEHGDGYETFEYIFKIPDDLEALLSEISSLKWMMNDTNKKTLTNLCERCHTAFSDHTLHHPGDAFAPTCKEHCDDMVLIELPIEHPCQLKANSITRAPALEKKHSDRISWETFKTHRSEQ